MSSERRDPAEMKENEVDILEPVKDNGFSDSQDADDIVFCNAEPSMEEAVPNRLALAGRGAAEGAAGVVYDVVDPSEVGEVAVGAADAARQRRSVYKIFARDGEYDDIVTYTARDRLTYSGLLAERISREIGADIESAGIRDVSKVLSLDISGATIREIEAATGAAKSLILRVRRCEAYVTAKKDILDEMVTAARGMISALTVKAVKSMAECVHSPNDRVKLAAATEILDRAGITAKQQIELTAKAEEPSVSLTDEDLVEIMRKRGAGVD